MKRQKYSELDRRAIHDLAYQMLRDFGYEIYRHQKGISFEELASRIEVERQTFPEAKDPEFEYLTEQAARRIWFTQTGQEPPRLDGKKKQ